MTAQEATPFMVKEEDKVSDELSILCSNQGKTAKVKA
jgi:hypothetical protein